MKQLGSVIYFALLFSTLYSQDIGEKIYAPDNSSGQFGYSVALSGQYALVGAPSERNDAIDTETGAVFLLKKKDTGWVIIKRIFEAEVNNMAYFGYSVDLNENYAVVGAPQEGNSGASFVYKRVGDDLIKVLKLPKYYRSEFGHAVAIDNDNIVVSALEGSGWDASLRVPGEVRVYSLTDGNVWQEYQKIAAENGYSFAQFGYDVDISGNNIVVGAWTSSADYFGRSSVYVYTKEDGNWIEKQRLFPAGMDTAINWFGQCVAIDDNTIAVGAQQEYIDSEVSGAVYIFEKNNDTWENTARLIAPDTTQFNIFGRSVEVKNNKVLIGGMKSVYLFENIDGSWQLKDFIHNDYENNGFIYRGFGESIALSDSNFIVGVRDDLTRNDYMSNGAVHFYTIDLGPAAGTDVQRTTNSVVYPNPVCDVLYIKSAKTIRKIEIYNFLGAMCQLEISNYGAINQVDFSGYHTGVYFLHIEYDKNDFKTFKIFKD